MLGGKREAQPGRAGRHGRRADRDDEEAVVAESVRGRERVGGIADDDRNDSALRLRQIERTRKEPRFAQRLGGIGWIALDQFESGDCRGAALGAADVPARVRP